MTELYQCDICKRNYTNKDDSIRCEESHVEAKEIFTQLFRRYKNDAAKYPLEIVVKMADGTTKGYVRDDVV